MANQRQLARDANEMTREMADQAAQTSRAISETAERAGRAAVAAFRRNAEAFSTTWRTSSEAGSRIAERSMEQFANLFGFTRDSARQSVQNSTGSIQALLNSSTALASGIQNVSSEWARFLQERVEQNLKSFDELMSCRTVQDCLAVQTRMMRDNVEACLRSVQRTSQLSTKLADDAVERMSDAALAPR
jgi:hypothetical protein